MKQGDSDLVVIIGKFSKNTGDFSSLYAPNIGHAQPQYLLKAVKRLEDIANLGNKLTENSKDPNLTGDVSLASRLYDHDARAIVNFLKVIAEYRPLLPKIKEGIHIYIGLARNLEIIANVMKYLASKNERELLEVKIADFFGLLTTTGFIDKSRLEIHNKLYEKNKKKVPASAYFAVMQLVKNAMKYTNGKVRLEFYKQQDSIIARVSDEGQGIKISHDKLHEIFQKFSTSGGGLGLQVCERLAHLQYGHITVKTTSEDGKRVKYDTRSNEPQALEDHGRGTSFELHIPIIDKKAPDGYERIGSWNVSLNIPDDVRNYLRHEFSLYLNGEIPDSVAAMCVKYPGLINLSLKSAASDSDRSLFVLGVKQKLKKLIAEKPGQDTYADHCNIGSTSEIPPDPFVQSDSYFTEKPVNSYVSKRSHMGEKIIEKTANLHRSSPLASFLAGGEVSNTGHYMARIVIDTKKRLGFINPA